MLTPDQVRMYVKDSPELNKLLDGELQNSDELIRLAMELTVGYANIVPPKTAYAIENFPSDTVMLYGVLHHLANGEAERNLRNNVTYNAQGLTTDIDNKFEQWTTLAGYYKGLFEQELRNLKQFENQEQAWGGVHSPYNVTHSWEYRS